MAKNLLYFGDNLPVLREEIADESADLIYLDPPFKSNQDYNVLFAERDGSRAAAQIKAFEDTWEWNLEAEAAYQQIVEAGGKVSQVMQAFRIFLGTNDLMAYLAMMAPRLVELHRVLKATGSLYLHCDPAASHYLKMTLDAVFGPAQFRNEIVWKRTSAHSSAKRCGPVHDIILYYTKSDSYIWNPQYEALGADRKLRHDLATDESGRLYRLSDLTGAGTRNGSSGKPWRGFDPTAIGRHWVTTTEGLDELADKGLIRFSSEGKWPRMIKYQDEAAGAAIGDVWDTIRPLNSAAKERLGYPTQKPEALLDRIILASSNEGDTVLDPFCGCGTAIASAQRLGRRWVGIDITHLAITLIKGRLRDAFGPEVEDAYEVKGAPDDLPGATALAEMDRFQFQWWALDKVGARPTPPERKKGADRGVDGRLYFHDDMTAGATKQVVLSVKSGKPKVSEVRDLIGVLDREKAAIGVYITLAEPTGPMRREATEAGFYESPWGKKKHPRVQILTVAELLAGKGIDMPPLRHTGQTFKKAPRAKTKGNKQGAFSFTPQSETPARDEEE